MPSSTRPPPQQDALTAALALVLRPLIVEAVRDALAEHAAAEATQPELLTIDQACAALQVSRATLHRLREAGLPCVMVLDSPRFSIAAVREWLEERTRERVGEAAAR